MRRTSGLALNASRSSSCGATIWTSSHVAGRSQRLLPGQAQLQHAVRGSPVVVSNSSASSLRSLSSSSASSPSPLSPLLLRTTQRTYATSSPSSAIGSVRVASRSEALGIPAAGLRRTPSPSACSPLPSSAAPAVTAVASRVAQLSTVAGGGSAEKKEGEGEGEEEPLSGRSGRINAAASSTTSDTNEKGTLAKVKLFVKKYGAVGIVTYFGLYGATLASFYGAFSSGLLFAGDVVGIIEFLHLGDVIDESKLSPKLGSFALAWIVTKFTEPIRFTLTLAVTPTLSRWWMGHQQQRIESTEKASTST